MWNWETDLFIVMLFTELKEVRGKREFESIKYLSNQILRTTQPGFEWFFIHKYNIYFIAKCKAGVDNVY